MLASCGDELGSHVDLNDNANFSVLCPALINVYTSLYVCWYSDELKSKILHVGTVYMMINE